jgi:hypothetical protein
VPSVISPCIASQPPKARMATWASAGTVCITAWRLAEMRALRMRAPNSRTAESVSLPSSRPSWPKPLTTRTPLVASSTTVASSAARCWASQLEGYTVLRSRRAMTMRAGTVTSATAVSGGDRWIMKASDRKNSTTLPLMKGRKPSSICTTRTSLLARDTNWPDWSSSWRAKSSRCRWS